MRHKPKRSPVSVIYAAAMWYRDPDRDNRLAVFIAALFLFVILAFVGMINLDRVQTANWERATNEEIVRLR